MRADRLLSLLMLLQTRGQMTARELASELEVSERTIYRDIDALSSAGVPVYASCGPGGGCALLDNYRTNLTGLTGDEIEALFMLSIPAPLSDLGVSEELKAAMRKLAAALPGQQRGAEAKVRQRIHLDSTGWARQNRAVPHLQMLQQALWEDRQVVISYRARFDAEFTCTVDPYGLVAKEGVWHLVGVDRGRLRVFRVSKVVGVRTTPETFARPRDFDLARFWQAWCAEQQNRLRFEAIVRVAPDFVEMLARIRGQQTEAMCATAVGHSADGSFTLNLPFASFFDARQQILSWGRGVEVLRPVALRKSVLDFAQQVASVYAT